MKVSVIIPCHNAERYLAQTIGSVLEQTRVPEEIVVVDDDSSDRSAAIADRFCDRVRRLHVRFRNAPKTRNHGFTRATGDAVMFLDADDVLGPRAIEALVAGLEHAPDAVALCDWYRLEKVDGKWVRRPPSVPAPIAGQDRLGSWLMGRYHPPCSVLWSRSAIERVCGWDEEAVVNNDGDIMMRAMIEGIPFIETSEGEAFYRRLPTGETSLSDTRLTRRGFEGGMQVLVKIARMIEERGRLPEYRHALDVAFDRLATHSDGNHGDLEEVCRDYRCRFGEPLTRRTLRSWRRRGRRIVKRRMGRMGPSAGSREGDEAPQDEEIRFGLRKGAVPKSRPSNPPMAKESISVDSAVPSDVPRVSVIIPTYNRAHLVSRAIRSVLAQTFSDFEVLVVDDGSTDHTAEVIRGIRDARVRYLPQSENCGVSAVRNQGMRAARAEFIAFLDSDDEWFPRKLERQLKVLEAAQQDVGLVYTGVQSVDDEGSSWNFRPDRRGDIYAEMLAVNPIHGGSSVMIRRNVIRSVGFFDEGIPAIEDFDYWLRIVRRYRVDFVEEPLVRYHDGRSLDRKSLSTDDNLAAREWFFKKHCRDMKRAGVAHRFLMDSARRQQKGRSRRMDGWRARRTALRAVYWEPWDWRVYWFLGRTLLPVWVRKLPRRLVRARQRRIRPEECPPPARLRPPE